MVCTEGDPQPHNDSSALQFPGGAEWAPYSQPQGKQAPGGTGFRAAYVWNPFGSGSSLGFLPVPVFKIKGTMAGDAKRRAEENHKNVGLFHVCVFCRVQ